MRKKLCKVLLKRRYAGTPWVDFVDDFVDYNKVPVRHLYREFFLHMEMIIAISEAINA